MATDSWKYDIVIVGLQPWHTAIGSNCVDIAKVFSKFARVLYVNRALDRRTILKQRAASFLKGGTQFCKKDRLLSEVLPNIWVLETGVVLESINLTSGMLHNYLLKRNNRKFASSINDAIRELSFNHFILFNDNDFFQGQFLKELLKPNLFLYYLRDYLIEQPYFKRNGKSMEAAIMRKADFIFTNSNYLKQYASRFNSNVQNIGQGCNHQQLELSRAVMMPQELRNRNSKIVGYIGSLVKLRLDLHLLEVITKRRSDILWVFVGPMDKHFKMSKMQEYPNVIFTGPCCGDDLIDYLYHFEVCINPQCLNRMTIGNYPRKLDEYFYFGKPVVVRKTDFTEELGNLVYQYENTDEFSSMIDLALQEERDSPKREKRIKISKENTWENSVHLLVDTVNQLN